MIDLGAYRDRLAQPALDLLGRAVEESRRRRHFYLGAEHIFWAAGQVQGGVIEAALRDVGADPRRIRRELERNLSGARAAAGRGEQVPEPTKALFREAWEAALRSGRGKIDLPDLVETILRAEASVPAKILSGLGVDPGLVAVRLRIHAREQEAPAQRRREKSYDLPAALAALGRNMNKEAREGRYPPLVGREAELERMAEILCHRERASSVIVTGEPGVGKSALVEGLAQRIEFEPERLPKRLRDRQIVNLQMNTVVAGTVFRGMFEDRLEKIIKELKDRPEYILFVDEVHTLVGAGSAMGVPADAANIFKQALARGEVQIIGATTQSEYRQTIAEDGALARRFRVVDLDEPNLEETGEILEGYRARLEENYGVEVAPEAVRAALELSARHQRSAHLPDKVIGWLDTACVKAEIAGRASVGEDDVIAVVAQETRIPEDLVRRRSAERFADAEERLAARVVGQRRAVEAVAKHLRLSKGPLKAVPSRPDGVMLFLGPTGVGKTELAKAAAELLFGDERRMIRIDMSEYGSGSLSADKLIGMPRGIVGSERGGVLTSRLRDQPYSLLLLDEIEKASPEVRNLFLQAFDEGWIADGRGRRVYLSDAFVVMTSNLGSDQFKKHLQPLGFRADDAAGLAGARESVVRELERTFSPEFIGRIDEVVVFDPLSEKEVETIAERYLAALAEEMRKSGRTLAVGEGVAERLAKTGYSLKYGARFLKRSIDERVKMPITLAWESRRRFRLAMKDGEPRVL